MSRDNIGILGLARMECISGSVVICRL